MHLLEKRKSINCELLESISLRSDFLDFSTWLGLSSGFKKAALVLSRHAQLFQEVDRQWHKFPTYPKLLELFGADYLRRNEKILEWLKIKHNYFIDEKLKKEIVEEHRIQRMLSMVPNESEANSIIILYENTLRCRLKHGKIALQTLRLSLTPAIALMKLSGYVLPNTKIVCEYLKNSPGQRSSLTGFIVFLRKEYGLDIDVPSESSVFIMRNNQLERKLVSFIGADLDEAGYIYWCKCSLEFFHGLNLSIKTVSELFKEVKMSGRGCTIIYKDEFYFIPHPSLKSRFK